MSLLAGFLTGVTYLHILLFGASVMVCVCVCVYVHVEQDPQRKQNVCIMQGSNGGGRRMWYE